MNEILFLIVFLIIGFITGTATGLFGIGGGAIFIPVLHYLLPLLNVPETIIMYVIIATSLFAGVFASGASFTNHLLKKNVLLKKGLLLSLGSAITALIVPYFVVKFDQATLRYIVIGVLFLVAIKMLTEKEDKTGAGLNLPDIFLFIAGLFAGFLSAITGLGGGVVFVPALLYLFSFSFRNAIGTSLMAVFVTMLSSSISFALLNTDVEMASFSLGYVNLIAGIPLGIGAVAGSKLGVNIVFKYKPIVIKRIFSLFLIASLFEMIFG